MSQRGRGRPHNIGPYKDLAFRLLLNLLRVASIGQEAWVGYSRSRSDYSVRPEYPSCVTYHRLIKVVQWIEALGWTETKPGYYDWSVGRGRQTLVRATPALLNRFAGFVPAVTQAPLTDRELIRLKGADKKPVLDYPDTPQLEAWRDKLRRINQQIASSTLDFGLSLRDRLTMSADLRARHQFPDLSRIQLYRSFNDGRWDRGGRFYGGWWINLPSQYRKHITIDGEVTTELDFSSYHISMLYGLERQPIPVGDLYDIGWGSEYRPMVKKFVNALLYAEDGEEAAINAMLDFRFDDVRLLWEPFNDLPPVVQQGRKNGLLQPMLAVIKSKHAPVAHRFGQGDGTRLQAVDAEIAELVLMTGVWLKITVLPIHDSFIVPVSQAKYFEEHMKDTFASFFAQAIDVKAKSAVPPEQ